MKSKVFMLFFLIGVMLFAGVSVFAESDSADAVSVIEPLIAGASGEIELENFGVFYEVSKASDNKLDFCVLNSDGKDLNLSAVDKITVIELGITLNKYTPIKTKEYNFAENTIDSAYDDLDNLINKATILNILSYTLDKSGNIETIYIPGGCSGANERDTNFGKWMNAKWKFNADSTISSTPPAVEVAYQLYETPIIFGYSYDLDKLSVSVVDKSQLQDGKEYNGYIYDKTDDGKIKMMLVSLGNVKYTGGVIDTISKVKKNGKDVYKITMYARGIISGGEPIVDAFVVQNGSMVQHDITVTKYTESLSIIDDYEPKDKGTDYSEKIASAFYPGAMIYYKENDKGEICGIEKLYPITSETGKITDSEPYYKTEFFTTYNLKRYKGWLNEGCECYIVYGKVVAKKEYGLSNITIDTMCIINQGDLPQNWLITADYSKASIQIVDYSKKNDEDKVYLGTIDDIKLRDYVVARKQNGSTKEIVVYKNFDLNDYLGIVPVSGVKLDKTTLDLNVGNVDFLKVTVKPSSAANKKVSWTSSDENVVKVEAGVVTAVGEGIAVITVTTDDGGKTAECAVTVGEKQEMFISDLTNESGLKFSVNLSPAPKGRVIAALYKDGTFVEAKTVLPSQEKIDFEFSSSGDEIKVFWFDFGFRMFVESIECDI